MYPKLTARVIDLARRSELSKDDWFELLQERADQLKGELHGMTLRSAALLPFIRDYFHEHEIGRDTPQIVDSPPHLTQDILGIYPSCPSYYEQGEANRDSSAGGSLPPATIRFWCLSKKGQWIGVSVHVTRAYEPYKYPGRFEEVARARTLTNKEFSSAADLCEFVKVHPRQIWDQLGESVNKWVEHRRILLSSAELLQDFFEHERKILNTVSPKVR